MLGIGTHYLDLNDKFSGCVFYRAGLYYPIASKLELSGDLGYFHIENFENEDAETPQQNTGGTEQASGSGKVNLNTAGKEELMTLSGIGESRADAIIAYREANGPFGSVEEIMNIEGIKEKMFEKIRGSIEV